MYSHLSSRPCRVGVTGDGCRHHSEEIEKESTVVDDQRDEQEERGNSDETEACKYRKFERRRATSGAD